MLNCIKRPLIGISGNCGRDGTSGLTLDGIHINMRRVANVSDTFLKASELLNVYEEEAINQVISDVTLGVAEKHNLTSVLDSIDRNWNGEKDDCDRFEGSNPIGLRIEKHCRDMFQAIRINTISLYVDTDFTVTAVIKDGDVEIEKILEFKKGLNVKRIDYTFVNSVGEFWMRLCNGAVAYFPENCCCQEKGKCACNQCANIYAINMVEGAVIECDDEVDDDLGYQDTLKEGNTFLEPKCVSMSKNPFGFSVSCICNYDHLFCQFQKEMAPAVRYWMGIMIMEEAITTGRFNEYAEGIKERAEYFLKDWKGGQPEKFSEYVKPGKYYEQIKLLVKMMCVYISKQETACLSCRPVMYMVNTHP